MKKTTLCIVLLPAVILLPAATRAEWTGNNVYAEYLSGARARGERLGFRVDVFCTGEVDPPIPGCY